MGEGLGDVTETTGVRPVLSCPLPDPAQAEAAAEAFARRTPGLSARTTLTPDQRRMAERLFSVIGLMALLMPELLIQASLLLAPFLFAAIILFRLFLVMSACLPRRHRRRVGGSTPLRPVYTVLVALKDEAACVPQLSRVLAGLDYPETLLDLKLIIVPRGKPQTKPRALNYGLARARGTYVVVYDAEDRPHPGQLKAAVQAFNRAGPETVCLQAPLVGVPAKGGWLARHWALEYAIQFGLLVPALARLGLPIALGGTSNHFRRAPLVSAGGWDAWNVTEDADLGLRLARLGHKVGAFASPTLEAPPEAGKVWLAQRSRWLKVYVQTWCVLMRALEAGTAGLPPGAMVSVQLTLGAAILSAIVHGPWALWCLACLLSPSLSLGPWGFSAFVLSLATGGLSALLAPGRRSWQRLADIATLPLYWPLQTLAMARALYSLVCSPHYWAKTPHGV